MSNEALLILNLIVVYGSVILWYYFLRDKGLFCWTVLATVAANIEVKDLKLNVGDNVLEIIVTAENKTKKTYTVIINREKDNQDTNLRKLKIEYFGQRYKEIKL